MFDVVSPHIASPKRDLLLTAVHGVFSMGNHELELLALAFQWSVTVVYSGLTGHTAPRGTRLNYGLKNGRPLTLTFECHPSGNHWSFNPSLVKRRVGKHPRDARAAGKLFKHNPAPAGSADLVRELQETFPGAFRPYTIDYAAAKVYARDVSSGFTGTGAWSKVYSKSQLRAIKAIAETAKRAPPPRNIQLMTTVGAAGCAKTSRLYPILSRAVPGAMAVTCPRAPLREQWSDKLNLGEGGWMVQTMEIGLASSVAPVRVFDEFPLFSKGAIDLALMLDLSATHVIALGDPTQTQAHETNADAACEMLPSTLPRFLAAAAPYEDWTYRNAVGVAARLGVPCLVDRPGNIYLTRHVLPGLTILTPATNSVNIHTTTKEAGTYGSYQGKDFPDGVPYQVQITQTTIDSCGDEAIYTAFSRGKSDVYAVCSFPFSPDNLAAIQSRPLLASILHLSAPRPHAEIFAMALNGIPLAPLPSPPIPPPELPIVRGSFRDYVYRSSRAIAQGLARVQNTSLEARGRAPISYLTETPNLESWFSGLTPEDALAAEVIAAEYEAIEAPAPRIVPTREVDATQIVYCEPIGRREDREVYLPTMSEQFPDVPASKFDTALVEALSLFPTHSAADPATYALTIEKRVRLSTEMANRLAFSTKKDAGIYLFDSICEMYSVDPLDPIPYDPDLMEACILENEAVKLTKGIKTLVNNEGRADPDWDPRHIEFFIKAQEKAKMACLNSAAKAAQGITLMADQVVMRIGAIVRYKVAVYEKRRHINHWRHNKKSLDDLNRWCAGRWLPGTGFTNDFSQFDTAQDAGVLFAEELAFEHLSLPAEAIDFYVNTFLSSACFLGTLAVMRFSGQPNTLNGNSDYTEGYTNLKYYIAPRIIAGSGHETTCGDDVALDFVPVPRPEFVHMAHLFPVESKEVVTAFIDFCSVYLTEHGIFKDPTILALRILLARAKYRAPEVAGSYYLEHFFLEDRLDLFLDRLTYDQLRDHVSNRYWFTANRGLIPHFLWKVRAFYDSAFAVFFKNFQQYAMTRRAVRRRDPLVSSLFLQAPELEPVFRRMVSNY
jgi:hypothetical protein